MHEERNLIRTDISSIEIAKKALDKTAESVVDLLDMDEIVKCVVDLKNDILTKIEEVGISIETLVYESKDVVVKNEGAVTRFVLSLFEDRDNYKDISKQVVNA